MGIHGGESLKHWNYFLALEADLKTVSRYIEFENRNFSVYSIELAHLLLAASSEVDVLLKSICNKLAPKRKVDNILQYHKVIYSKRPDFLAKTVLIPRFNLTLRPWVSWDSSTPPIWWTAHNKVKHQRDTQFDQANLKNTLNSLAALYICIGTYYKLHFRYNNPITEDAKLFRKLVPAADLFQFENESRVRGAQTLPKLD